MYPAPLDLSTGRKHQPVVRIFRTVLPLDLTWQADSGTAEKGKVDALPKNLPGSSVPCEKFVAEGLDSGKEWSYESSPAEVLEVGLEVELDGSLAAEGDDGLPMEHHERSAVEYASEVQLNGSSVKECVKDNLQEKLYGSSALEGIEESRIGAEELDLRNDWSYETYQADVLELDASVTDEREDDDLHELNGWSVLEKLHEVLEAEQFGNCVLEQVGSSASPRRPFTLLPVQTNRNSAINPRQPQSPISRASFGNLSSSSLNGVTKTKRQKYNQETLSIAIQQVRDGTMTLYRASKDFAIPKNTLAYRLGEQFKNKGRRGPETALTSDEEAKIVSWIKEMQRKAFPVTTEAVRRKIAVFFKENPRPNPFRENKPGRRWLEGFLRRHKDVSIRTPEAISKASANVSEQDLRNWHGQVEQYAHDNDLEDVLEDPSRMLSGDETGMPMNAMAKRVLAETGSQNVSMVEPSNAKQTTTVLFTFSADGHAYPPLVILPQKRISKELAQHYPGDWGLGGTETGWIDTPHFIGHIKKVLYPALVRRNVKFPVIYFVDGHKSHLSLSVVEACLKLNIILISLYPNSTRIIQPADVGVFGPLKHYWRQEVEKFKAEIGEDAKITPMTFPAILQRAMQRAFTLKTISQAFKPCGIYPFNADAVDYRKCFGKTRKGFSPPEDSNLSSSTEGHASHNHDSFGHTSLDHSRFNHSGFSSFGNSTDATLGQASSSRSYRSFDVSLHDTFDESAESILPTSASQSIEPSRDIPLSGRTTSLECDISKYLTTPKTPERARKHINYKTKSNPVLTAAERLEEIRSLEEEKKNLLQRKIELAEKRVQQKIEDEVEKKKRIEERKRKLEESEMARAEKQRKIEERKKKSEEKRAELEEEKRKRFEERVKKAEERKRKQEAIAERKQEREAKKKKMVEPSDEDSVSVEESGDENETEED